MKQTNLSRRYSSVSDSPYNRSYRIQLLIFGEGEGFIKDRHIIKLESIEDDTVSLPQDEDYKMILIPMDQHKDNYR